MLIDLFIKQKESYVKRNIHVIESILISVNSDMNISTNFSISKNRDFLFESSKKTNFILFHHIIDFYPNKIVVRNDFSKMIQILKNFRLESVTKMIYDDCFQIATDIIHRAIKTSKMQNVVAMFTFLIKFFATVSTQIEISTYQFKKSKKIKLSNDIMTYENSNPIIIYAQLIDE